MTSTEYALPLDTITARAHGQLADKHNRMAHIATIWGITWVADDSKAKRDQMLEAVEADAYDEAWTRGYKIAAAEWAEPWPTDPS